MTIGFHFLFPPITIGLAWLLVWLESRDGKRPGADILSRLFGKLFAILYIVGIGTGIVMTLQFGTNWSRFMTFVNGIFGPLLVAEVLIAFFMESIFFGIWLFGRGRVGEGLRKASILLVAIGATISGFFITCADSWMQTPAGYVLSDDGTRAILTDFWAALFNPSALSRFGHVLMSAMTITGFFVAGISAWLVLKNKGSRYSRTVLAVGVCVALVGAGLSAASGVSEMFRLGGQQIEKVSVFRGTAAGAGPALGPGYDDVSAASIPAANADLPPLELTKNAFWTMIYVGSFMLAFMLIAFAVLVFRRLPSARLLLWLLVWAIPLPIVSTQAGWMAAEVGRQPWLVWKLLRTADSVSVSVSSGMLVFSLVLIGLVYVLFLGISVGMIVHELRKLPPVAEAAPSEGGVA
jgi:cytochrome d ubiquinol oxidase subunit I